MLRQFTEDDFYRLFSKHTPILLDRYEEDSKAGDVTHFYRMTCCYCGRLIPRATRRDRLYHETCKSRVYRERKEFIEQHWFGFVILYIFLIAIENLKSYESKSNSTKS